MLVLYSESSIHQSRRDCWKKMVSLVSTKTGASHDILYVSVYIYIYICVKFFSQVFCILVQFGWDFVQEKSTDAVEWLSFVKMMCIESHTSLWSVMNIHVYFPHLFSSVDENLHVASEHNAVDYLWVLWKLGQGKLYYFLGIREITYIHAMAFSASRPYPHHFTPLHHLAEALWAFVSTCNGKYHHKLLLLCFPKTSCDFY